MLNSFNENVLNEIILTCKKHLDPIFIYLFGSAAQGTVTEDSDLDLAFISKKEFSRYDLLIFAQQLADIAGRDIDLVNLADISTVFRAQIIGKGRPVYSNDDYFMSQYEIRALKEYAKLNEERKEIIDRIIKEKTIYG